jgi:hypothetical protein
VVTDKAFLKPFAPQEVANRLLQSDSEEIVILKHYRSDQDIALGLSEVLAIQQFHPRTALSRVRWGFVPSTNPSAAQLPLMGSALLTQPFTLWKIASLGEDTPPPLTQLHIKSVQNVSMTANCNASQPVYRAMGISYQRYDCQVS